MGLYMVEGVTWHKARVQLAAHKNGRKSWMDGSFHKVQILGSVSTIIDHHVQSAIKRFKEIVVQSKMLHF